MDSVRTYPWKATEDRLLSDLVREIGMKKWKKIHSKFLLRFPNSARSYLQCRERYFNHLRPGIIKGRWQPHENELLFQLHRLYANNWSEIQKFFPHRTQNSIKCHFHSTLKQALFEYNLKCNGLTQTDLSLKSLVRDRNVTIFFSMGSAVGTDMNELISVVQSQLLAESLQAILP